MRRRQRFGFVLVLAVVPDFGANLEDEDAAGHDFAQSVKSALLRGAYSVATRATGALVEGGAASGGKGLRGSFSSSIAA